MWAKKSVYTHWKEISTLSVVEMGKISMALWKVLKCCRTMESEWKHGAESSLKSYLAQEANTELLLLT